MDEAVNKNFKVSVVIPALNEAESLPHVLPRIPRDVHEVILVDGASIDATMDKARELMPQIRLVHQDRPGKGAALRCGFAAATGDIVVHLDADGSTDPAEIPAFVNTLLAGADYAKGSRFAKGARTDDITPLRRLGNWGFIMMANILFGSRFTDITYGYNAMWRRHYPLLAPEIDGWAHEIVGNIRAHRRGLRIVEVASVEAPRVAGEPKLRTFSAGWAILKAIVSERFRSLPVPAGAAAPSATIGAGTTLSAELGSGMVTVPIVADEPLMPMPIRANDDLSPALAAADQAV